MGDSKEKLAIFLNITKIYLTHFYHI